MANLTHSKTKDIDQQTSPVLITPYVPVSVCLERTDIGLTSSELAAVHMPFDKPSLTSV